MSLSVNTNVTALNANRNLAATSNSLTTALARLSSGKRINSAADDAAGLAISAGLRSQANGAALARRNAQDGISLLQTAEGALQETHTMLQRIRDIAVQSANATYTSEQREHMQAEVTQLVKEITRIAEGSTFDRRVLFDGSHPEVNLQVGANGDAASSLRIDLPPMRGKDLGLEVPRGSATVSHDENHAGHINHPHDPLVGGVPDPWNFPFPVVEPDIWAPSKPWDLQPGRTRTMVDTTGTPQDGVYRIDGAGAVLDSAGRSVGTIDPADGTMITFSDGSTITFDGSVYWDEDHPEHGGTFRFTNIISVLDQDEARDNIAVLDAAISQVSTVRAEIGASQNRLSHTLMNLGVSEENLRAALSRVEDTDMAVEMMNLTRSQILSQAGTAMLAQANSVPRGVLSLLG